MGRATGLLLAGVVGLVVAGCGGSSSSSSSTTASAPSSGETVHLSAVPGKLAFNTTKLTAKAGTVTLAMSNPSTFPHGIAIEGNGVDKDGKVVHQGGNSTVTVKLKPGTYTFYCPVPGHRQGGMQGTLTVS